MTVTYTYDETHLADPTLGPLYRTRRLLNDVGSPPGTIDQNSARHSDQELTYLYSEAAGNVYMTAVKALEAELVQLALDGNIIKLTQFGDNEQSVFQNLQSVIKYLKAASGAGLAVLAPDAVFTADSDDGNTLGTTHTW